MEQNIEHTYIMIKPDGVEKQIISDVINRFEEKGLVVLNPKEMYLNEKLLREHYAHIVERSFYPDMETHMMSGPVYAMIVKGVDAVRITRELIGATCNAEPGTIRGDYADKKIMHKNVIHGSDSVENAKIEISRFYENSKVFHL